MFISIKDLIARGETVPKFRNVRIKMANGKTRLQRAQVLKSGKLKFVKNRKSSPSRRAPRRAPSKAKKRNTRRVSPARGRKMGGKLFKIMSGTGMVEDALIGYVGLSVFSGMGQASLPFTRVVQGIAGQALNRRGKGRLMYGLVDLLDVYLSQGAGLNNILDEVKQALKISA